MNLTVITGPDPTANREELFKRTPLSRPVCAIVPDNHSVIAMQRYLARECGGAFVGHRIHTFESLGMEILSSSGETPLIIGNHVRRALIGEIVRSRIDEWSEFHPISSYPGFIDLLGVFLEDVRSRSDGRISSRPELVAIAKAYESHLLRLGMNDHEGIVIRAGVEDKADSFAGIIRGALIVDGFYDMTDRQYMLLEKLIRCFYRCSMTLVCDLKRTDLFRLPLRLLERLQAIGAKTVEVEAPDIHVPACVFSGFRGGEYPENGDKDAVQVHTFRSVTSEADWIAGTIRSMIASDEVGAADIMIVSRFPLAFGSPLERALNRHSVPVESGFMRPITAHPLVRLMFDAIEASIHPERKILFTRVQTSGFTGDPADKRTRFPDRLDEKGWSCRIVESDTPEGFTESIKAVLDDLHIRENLPEGNRNCSAVGNLAVYERILELLDEFASVYRAFKKMMRADECLRLLRSFLAPVMVTDGRTHGRGVIVADANHARYIRRDVVFLTGLDDESFPAGTRGFSFHDSDIACEYTEHDESEEPLLFFMSASGARKLIMTFPGIDDEGADNTMSPYLREILDGVSLWLIPRFHAGIPGAAWESGAHSDRARGEHAMRELRKNRSHAPVMLHAIDDSDPFLSQRIGKALRSYSVRTAANGLDLSMHSGFCEQQSSRSFSVTELETYLSCPVKYFFSSILGLRVEPKIPGDIDHATRGMIIHSILSSFYRARLEMTGRTRFSRSELPECRRLMQDIVGEVFTGAVAGIEDIHVVNLIAVKKFITEWMDAFLDREIRYFEETKFSPANFETGFGVTRSGREMRYPSLEIGSSPLPVNISGRIDRIDVEGEEEHLKIRIIDYKTGEVKSSLKDITDGPDLQIPLYLEAAACLMYPGGSIHDGLFYSLKNMDLQGYKIGRTPVTGDDWNELIEAATLHAVEAVSSIRSGSFPLPEKSCNSFCDFYTVCRGGYD